MSVRAPWKVIGALCLAALTLGVAIGWQFVTLSETDVINAAAQRYVTDHPAARVEHCMAQPGIPPIWITVICAPPGDAATVIYQSDRFGRLQAIEPTDPSLAAGA